MTVTRIRNCSYCTRPALEQAPFFTNNGQPTIPAVQTAPLCHAHHFQTDYRNSPTYQQTTNTTFTCPECDYGYADLSVDYTLILPDQTTINTVNHPALTLSLEWDLSDVDGEIWLDEGYISDTCYNTLASMTTRNSTTASLLQLPHLLGQTVRDAEADNQFNAILDSLEYGAANAQCSNCGYELPTYW